MCIYIYIYTYININDDNNNTNTYGAVYGNWLVAMGRSPHYSMAIIRLLSDIKHLIRLLSDIKQLTNT